jgi:hypothetical protein
LLVLEQEVARASFRAGGHRVTPLSDYINRPAWLKSAPQGLKPRVLWGSGGTTKVVPCYKTICASSIYETICATSATPAQYLLRIDDLCPTVSRERWSRFRALVDEFRLQPILAVVPDNRDPELQASADDSSFWHEMRSLESAGALIGLHGYRHLCDSRGRSRLGLDRASEFAGVPMETQRTWIREGLEILRGHGLNPRIFVAPRHGFDAGTLSALHSEGIVLLSDGFARRPFLCEGITWIPQQLWAPIEKASGVWTVCVHPNTASDAGIGELRAFLRAHAGEFTSVDRLLGEFPPATLTLAERIQAEAALCRFKLFRIARRAHHLIGSRFSRSR